MQDGEGTRRQERHGVMTIPFYSVAGCTLKMTESDSLVGNPELWDRSPEKTGP